MQYPLKRYEHFVLVPENCNSKFVSPYLTSAWKCMQINTHKPSIGPVVLEYAHSDYKNNKTDSQDGPLPILSPMAC